MRDLQQIYKECVQECKDAKIPIRDNKVIEIDFRDEEVKGGRGICILDKTTGEMSIYITTLFSNDSCPIEELKDIVIHELIHTCPRCWNHKKTWMKYAKIMNDKYGYELTTSKDYDAVFHKEKPILHRYICEGCGSFFNLRTEDETYFDENIYYSCPFCDSEYIEIN